MALTRVSEILKMADEAHTSAIAFICIDYNTAYSVARAAEETNTPAIIMLLWEHNAKMNTMNMKGFAAMARELAQGVKVPIGVHLDHGYDYAEVFRAMNAGFNSVMIDGSAHPLEENIAITKKVTETAHLLGVDVEAELGHVGMAVDHDGDKSDFYTDPAIAERFCRETDCDYLTISIGNAHGVYVETPHLDIARLEEINAATDTPLVLHGGSGIPDEQLEVAFRKGINKFNLGTDFLAAYYQAILDYNASVAGDDNPYKMLDLPMYTQEKLVAFLKTRLALCHF
ncbi:MAG: class II fructose-bisphosphate aldolase [Lachnospiraceae bacterium]|nr:class II fructose-bisphosphate aldolase [Lachnospiraceae bacterium]